MTVNHVGLRVRDLDASKRFYEALGFTEKFSMDVDDAPTDRLLSLDPPLGLRVVYLTDGPFVLELLTFDEHEGRADERVITDIGLTHLSIGVDDVEAAKAAVVDNGGEVVTSSDLGAAVMVRDPDGQMVELLQTALRPVTPH